MNRVWLRYWREADGDRARGRVSLCFDHGRGDALRYALENRIRNYELLDSRPDVTGAKSLSQVLSELGLKYRRSKGLLGEMDIHQVRGRAHLIFRGKADDVWRWLHETGRLEQ